MPEQMAPLSLRISAELNTRLTECASKLRLKKHALAQMAVEAAVEAVEQNSYQLVVPIQFAVTQVAVPKAEGTTSHTEQSRGKRIANAIRDRAIEKVISSQAAESVAPERTSPSSEAAGPAALIPAPQPGPGVQSGQSKPTGRPSPRKRNPRNARKP